jgi:hypothetical protein
MSETALAIAKDYPQDKFNLLIPVRTMQELSPLHKVVINEVQISPDPKQKDTYSQSGGLALTKNGLMKLMAAANIQIIDSRAVPPQRCNKCIEIAERTRQAPKCFECPYIDDIAHQVTIAVPEPSGTYRTVRATKEIRMEDAKATMKDSEFKQFAKFKTEHCESKALNRALREGLMIKSTYTAQELQKPFAVALVMPNMSDPDLKAAMIERYANNASALYGSPGPAQLSAGQATALPEGSVTIIDADDDIDFETGEIIPPSQQVIDITPEDDDPITCDECEAVLEPITDKTGKEWTVADLVDLSMGHFNRILCPACYNKAFKAEKAAKKKEGKK